MNQKSLKLSFKASFFSPASESFCSPSGEPELEYEYVLNGEKFKKTVKVQEEIQSFEEECLIENILKRIALGTEDLKPFDENSVGECHDLSSVEGIEDMMDYINAAGLLDQIVDLVKKGVLKDDDDVKSTDKVDKGVSSGVEGDVKSPVEDIEDKDGE